MPEDPVMVAYLATRNTSYAELRAEHERKMASPEHAAYIRCMIAHELQFSLAAPPRFLISLSYPDGRRWEGGGIYPDILVGADEYAFAEDGLVVINAEFYGCMPFCRLDVGRSGVFYYKLPEVQP